MENLGLLARLVVKPGKEQEVVAFIKKALPLVEREPDTINWYALQIGPSTFGIFGTFENEEGREAHLGGEMAKALMARAPDLFTGHPVAEKVEIIALK